MPQFAPPPSGAATIVLARLASAPPVRLALSGALLPAIVELRTVKLDPKTLNPPPWALLTPAPEASAVLPAIVLRSMATLTAPLLALEMPPPVAELLAALPVP